MKWSDGTPKSSGNAFDWIKPKVEDKPKRKRSGPRMTVEQVVKNAQRTNPDRR